MTIPTQQIIDYVRNLAATDAAATQMLGRERTGDHDPEYDIALEQAAQDALQAAADTCAEMWQQS